MLKPLINCSQHILKKNCTSSCIGIYIYSIIYFFSKTLLGIYIHCTSKNISKKVNSVETFFQMPSVSIPDEHIREIKIKKILQKTLPEGKSVMVTSLSFDLPSMTLAFYWHILLTMNIHKASVLRSLKKMSRFNKGRWTNSLTETDRHRLRGGTICNVSETKILGNIHFG